MAFSLEFGMVVFFVFLIICVLFYWCFDIFNPYVYNSNMNEIMLKTVLQAENDGCVSQSMADKLYTTLEAKGIPRNKVTLVVKDGDNNIMPMGREVGYGEPFSMTLTFNYEMKLLKAVNGILIKEDYTYPITSGFSCISHKGRNGT